MRRCRELKWFCGCLVALLLAMVPGRAFGHSMLVGSSPAAHAVVAAGRVPAFELRFSSRVDGARSKVTLTAKADARPAPDVPKSGRMTLALGPVQQPRPEVLSVAPVGDLVAGVYTLHWVVLAGDGHLSRGEIVFTVR